jgi:hypothetical protein
MTLKFKLAAAMAAITLAMPSQAIQVIWADWQTVTTTTTSGQLATSTPISIDFSSPSGFGFVQTGSGTNFWTEPNPASRPYTGGVVENAPPAAELVALSTAGPKTITFGQPISGLYLAIISWNGNAAQFNQPFQVISSGQGYWGTGTITLGPNNNFVGTGEPHGILYFPGTFSSLTFTDTSNEFWHGVTVGVAGLAPAVPEPSAVAMLLAGFGLAGLLAARRRSPSAHAQALKIASISLFNKKRISGPKMRR